MVTSPTPLQRGEVMADLVGSGPFPAELFTAAVLGTPEDVAHHLTSTFVLQHEGADVYGQDLRGFGRQRRSLQHADGFNGMWPTTVVGTCANGAQLKIGGIECGKQTTAPGSFSPASGFRPSPIDARGEGWDCGPVRHLHSDTPAEHRAKGVKHAYFNANWVLKKSTDRAAVVPAFLNFLETVCNLLAEGHDVHIHCISPLTPPASYL
jgi:hypothetical protein